MRKEELPQVTLVFWVVYAKYLDFGNRFSQTLTGLKNIYSNGNISGLGKDILCKENSWRFLRVSLPNVAKSFSLSQQLYFFYSATQIPDSSPSQYFWLYRQNSPFIQQTSCSNLTKTNSLGAIYFLSSLVQNLTVTVQLNCLQLKFGVFLATLKLGLSFLKFATEFSNYLASFWQFHLTSVWSPYFSNLSLLFLINHPTSFFFFLNHLASFCQFLFFKETMLTAF